MPPHCDSLDGPVVKAAIKALKSGNVDVVLPYVPKEGEQEVINAFEKVIQIRNTGADVKDVADRYFFETVVRVHRAGEGAAFTGLKPAGLDVGPVIPLAEKAVETGDTQELTKILCDAIQAEVQGKSDRVQQLKIYTEGPVDKAREYVSAMLGLQVWSHKLYQSIKAPPHHVAHAE